MSNKRWGGENANPITVHNPISTPELDEQRFMIVSDDGICHSGYLIEPDQLKLKGAIYDLFMECLGDTEPVFAHQNGLESIGLSEAEQDSKRARNQLRQQTLNNLKNKLGVDNE